MQDKKSIYRVVLTRLDQGFVRVLARLDGDAREVFQLVLRVGGFQHGAQFRNSAGANLGEGGGLRKGMDRNAGGNQVVVL